MMKRHTKAEVARQPQVVEWVKACDAEREIARLREALEDLANVAAECDSWESFPSSPLDAAQAVLDMYQE